MELSITSWLTVCLSIYLSSTLNNLHWRTKHCFQNFFIWSTNVLESIHTADVSKKTSKSHQYRDFGNVNIYSRNNVKFLSVNSPFAEWLPSVSLPVYLSIYLSISLSDWGWLTIWLSNSLPANLLMCVCLTICLTTCSLVCLSTSRHVCLLSIVPLFPETQSSSEL